MIEKNKEEVLNGLMLGDGCLYLHKNGQNPCLSISRSDKDKEYLLENAEIFNQYLNPKSIHHRSIYDKRTNKTYQQTRLRTKCSEDFLPFHQKWYSNGKKIIPKDLKLTPTTMAIWLADDGCITLGKVKKEKRKNLLQLKLATHSFSKTDVEFLSDLIEKTYGVKPHIHKESKKEQYTLRIHNSQDTKKLLQQIDNYFPTSMGRKSDIWRNSEAKLWFKKSYPPCKWCSSNKIYKNGTENNKQKYLCKDCKKQFY